MIGPAFTGPFVGSKAALICEGAILIYLRDNQPGLPFAGQWDLPGGGREGDESGEACLLREVEEEFGLRLPLGQLFWREEFPSMLWPDKRSLFYAGRLTPQNIADIRFGNEGQRWEMMALEAWLAHPEGVLEMQRRTALALSSLP